MYTLYNAIRLYRSFLLRSHCPPVANIVHTVIYTHTCISDIVIINARVCSTYLCGMYLGIRSLCSEWVGGRKSGHSWVHMKTPMLHERERER